MKPGDVVSIRGVLGRITDIDVHDGIPDYLVRPLSPTNDFCGCGGDDCLGSNWFRQEEMKNAEVSK